MIHADAVTEGGSPRANRALDLLSLALSDVRYGLGAYLAVYLLTEHRWDEASIGIALSFGGLVGLVSQTPLGMMVDAVRNKRALLAGAVVIVTATCLAIPVWPQFWTVAAAGIIGALAGTTISPNLAAISLGIVGPRRFAWRAGRNEALFHLGNGAINVVILVAAPWMGTPIVFWMMGITALATLFATFAVPRDAIDHEIARGLLPDDRGHGHRPSAWSTLFASRPLLIFGICGALFHMANGPMLAMVAQKLALFYPGQGIMFTAACAIAAQFVMVPAAMLASRRADRWGRKPLLMAAFVALALRGSGYTLSDNAAWLLAVQMLDGVGAGLIGALFPVIVADLSKGSGHFNAAQGAVGTIHAIGGITGGAVTGFVVVGFGYSAAFLTLSAIAALGGALFWIAMPETRDVPPTISEESAPLAAAAAPRG